MDKLNDLKNDFLNEFSKIQDLEGPSYLYDPIKYFVKSPGKRLRPVSYTHLTLPTILLV